MRVAVDAQNKWKCDCVYKEVSDHRLEFKTKSTDEESIALMISNASRMMQIHRSDRRLALFAEKTKTNRKRRKRRRRRSEDIRTSDAGCALSSSDIMCVIR